VRLFCPELADPLKRREPAETLEAFREVVGVKKRGQVGSKLFVTVVVEAPDRGVLDRAIHSFDLPVRPRMIEFRKAMRDAMLCACQVKRVRSKGLMRRTHALDRRDAPAAVG
jgi:hypothetical protein